MRRTSSLPCCVDYRVRDIERDQMRQLAKPCASAYVSYQIVCTGDVRFVMRLVRATRQLKSRLARTRGTFTTADYWAETVAAHGHKEALLFEGISYTYADVDRECAREDDSKVAQWSSFSSPA